MPMRVIAKGQDTEYVPGIGTGLEDELRNLGDPPWGFFGEELLDIRRGVSGGVAPLPFARLSPIAFTNSFTDTPTNSEKSLESVIGDTC